MGFPKTKSTRIPNGYEPPADEPQSETDIKFVDYSVQHDASIKIGMVARYDEQKDHKTFLRHCRYPNTREKFFRFSRWLWNE